MCERRTRLAWMRKCHLGKAKGQYKARKVLTWMSCQREQGGCYWCLCCEVTPALTEVTGDNLETQARTRLGLTWGSYQPLVIKKWLVSSVVCVTLMDSCLSSLVVTHDRDTLSLQFSLCSFQADKLVSNKWAASLINKSWCCKLRFFHSKEDLCWVYSYFSDKVWPSSFLY